MFWKRRPPAYRILFATDLHGSDACFRKLLNAAAAYGARAVIVGGDLTGKALLPVVRRGGAWEARLEGRLWRLETEAELAQFMQRVRDGGWYPWPCEPDGVRELEESPERQHEAFLRAMREGVERWLQLVRERLLPKGIRFLVNCGNDDPFEVDAWLQDAEVVEFLEGRVVELPGGWELASCGYANLTPWRCHRDVPEEELADRIERLVRQVRDPARAIFNLHCPPYGSGLDVAPRLDEQLRPVVTGGVVETAPVGSTAVRAAIERYQPPLALHGHIHESRGAVRIGRTLCINPGSEYPEGILHACLIDLGEAEVLNYLALSA